MVPRFLYMCTYHDKFAMNEFKESRGGFRPRSEGKQVYSYDYEASGKTGLVERRRGLCPLPPPDRPAHVVLGQILLHLVQVVVVDGVGEEALPAHLEHSSLGSHRI